MFSTFGSTLTFDVPYQGIGKILLSSLFKRELGSAKKHVNHADDFSCHWSIDHWTRERSDRGAPGFSFRDLSSTRVTRPFRGKRDGGWNVVTRVSVLLVE